MQPIGKVMQPPSTVGAAVNGWSTKRRQAWPAVERLRQLILSGALAFALCVGAFEESRAQSSFPDSLEEWERDWTVLTMAPDGAWGVATDMGVIEALARAIRSCQAMSAAALGCGAHFTTVRAGWSIALRCGDKNVLVAEIKRDAAEFSAAWREHELRMLYDPDMPPCIRVVTVDPNGEVLPADPEYSNPVYSWQ